MATFQPDSFIVADVAPSPNLDERAGGGLPDMILLHYTGMQTGEAALARLTMAASKVSSHYVVFEDGRIVQLVPEAKRAWHAGVSSWAGETDINSRSIGIEIVNPGHEFGYRNFPLRQIAAVISLCKSILTRRGPLSADRILGHSDVAPSRKQDPGELFDWAGLAAQGIGLWPPLGPAAPTAASAAELLSLWGYEVDDRAAELAAWIAFQRHFRPSCCDGMADGECLARLQGLLGLAGEEI